jgi:ribose-phosphate pyrophosphokinase
MTNMIKVFAGSSAVALTESICVSLGCPPGIVEKGKYYNDCTMVRIAENVRGCDAFVVQTASPPVNDHLMELLMLVDALKGSSARRVTAVLPFFFYGQSDKKDKGRISITARLVADLLQAAGADRVLTLDLHAAQIQGFLHCPTDQLTAVPLLCDYFAHGDLQNTVAVSADVGRASLVRRYARRLGVPLAIVDKERLDSDVVTAHHVIGNVRGKRVLLFDDLIGTGGTVIEAARVLLEEGAREVAAGAVHGVLAGQAIERLEASPLCEVVVTDTLPAASCLLAANGSKTSGARTLRVLSVAPLLATAIQRIHDDESISALFT